MKTVKRLLWITLFIALAVTAYAQQDWVEIIPQTNSPLYVKVDRLYFGVNVDITADIMGSADFLTLYTGYNAEIINNWNLYGEAAYSGFKGESTKGKLIWGTLGTDYNLPIGRKNLSLGFDVPILLFSTADMFGPFDLISSNFILGMTPTRNDTGFGCKIEYSRMFKPSDFFESISFSIFYRSKLITQNDIFGITAKFLLSNGNYDNGYKIIPEFAMSNDIVSFYFSLPIRSRTAIDNSSGSDKKVFDLPLLSASMGIRIAPKW